MNESFYQIVAENIKSEAQLILKEKGLEGLAVRIENEKDEAYLIRT